MKLRLLKFELWGTVFISLLGSFLHFTFNLTNRFWLVGAFSAVNESTWEHLKLAVIPAVLWAVLESRVFKLKSDNFWCGKALGIWLMPALIIVFFYSYTAILGYNLLPIDISTFVVAVIIGQLVSYKVMSVNCNFGKFKTVSIVSIVVLLLAFIVFTFYPLHYFLFSDPLSGGYGIIK